MSTPYVTFWWLRDRRHHDITIASQSGEMWIVLGGIEGWWTEAEIREDYDILGRVDPRPIATTSNTGDPI